MRCFRPPPVLPSWRQGMRPYREEVVRMKRTLMHLCAFWIGALLVLAGSSFAFADFDETIGPDGEGACDSEVGELIDMDKLPSRSPALRRRLGLDSSYTEKSLPLLLIVVEFTDPAGKMEYQNGVDWNKLVFRNERCIRSYFRDMSYGKFTFEPAPETSRYNVDGNRNTKDQANDGVVHVSIDEPHENWEKRNTTALVKSLGTSLIKAIRQAEAHVDFTAFDADSNGEIETTELAIAFVVAGYESGVDDSLKTRESYQYLRAHRWTFSGMHSGYPSAGIDKPEVTRSGKTVKLNSYAAISECCDKYKTDENGDLMRDSNGYLIPTTVTKWSGLAHELGHHLGLPDLYDTQSLSESELIWKDYIVNRLSLMAAGSWARDTKGNYCPSGLDPWSRLRLGWLSPQTPAAAGVYDVSAQDYSNPKSQNAVLKVPIPTSSIYDEYYLVENRRYEKWDEGMRKIYGVDDGTPVSDTWDDKGGILLWHIDNDVIQHYSSGNKVNARNHRPGVMPLYPEKDNSGNYRLITDGSDITIYRPFYDLYNWNKYFKSPIGQEIDLPSYDGTPLTYGPGTRTSSGVKLELISNSANVMQIRFIPKGHVHSFTYRDKDYDDGYCEHGGYYWHVSTCMICGLVRKEQRYGTSGHDLEIIDAFSPRCTEDGCVRHYLCNICGKRFSYESGGTEEISASDVSLPATGHTWGEWITTEPAGYGYDGTKVRFCENCTANDWGSIPMIAPCSKGAPLSAAEEVLKTKKTEKDPAGSEFAKLKLRQARVRKRSIRIHWNKCGAKRYIVYGRKCGKTRALRKIASTKNGYMTVRKIAGAKLRKATYYKFVVVAVNGSNKVISTSKMVHIATTGRKSKSNYTAVAVSKARRTKAKNLRAGKTLALKASAKKRRGTRVNKHIGLRYQSTKPAVATVSGSGKITAKSAGRCTVYAYAQNGKFKAIPVVVR